MQEENIKSKYPNMKGSLFKCLITMFLVVLSTPLNALELSVSADQVALNKTVSITISDRSDEDLRSIDLRPLEKDFELGQPNFSSEISIINGRQNSQQKLSMVLQPKRLGSALIPALRLGNKSTRPVRVSVTEAIPNPSSMYGGAVSIEVSVSKGSPYQGEQFVYTLKLFHRVAMENIPPKLELDNSIRGSVESLQKKEYQTQQGQNRFAVQEWRFVVSIDEPGAITIPSPVIKGELYEQRRSFFRTQGVPFEIEAEAVRVNIKPLPNGVRSTLTAQALELRELPIDKGQLEVGQPVTRRIEIQAKGLKAERLPAIKIDDQANFNVYSEPPVFDNEEWLGGYSGTRRDNFAIIPTKAGLITLPEIRIEWFNTQTGRPETSVLPALQLDIQASNSASPQIPPTDLALGTEQNKQSGSIIRNSQPNSNQGQPDLNGRIAISDSSSPQNPRFWIMLFCMALLAWIATVVSMLLMRRYYLEQLRNSEFNSSNELVSASEKSPSVEKLKKRAIQACKNNDAQQAKQNTLLWQRKVMQRLTPDQQQKLARVLLELDRHLFSAQSAHWDGQALAGVISEITTTKNENKIDGLNPLYPKTA